jgi:hypothetical protein
MALRLAAPSDVVRALFALLALRPAGRDRPSPVLAVAGAPLPAVYQ